MKHTDQNENGTLLYHTSCIGEQCGSSDAMAVYSKEGKGTLGAIVGTLVTPVLDCYGEVITEVGTEVTISTGCLKADDCWYYWTNPSELLGKIVEFEYFSYGLKEKPRFAQFKRVRSEVDMG